MRRELRDRLFVSLCFRDVHREMGLSLSRSLESTEHHSDSDFIFEFCRKVVSMFRKCFRPICHTVVALYFRSDLANLEVLHVSHDVDHFLRLLAEWIDRAILF